MAFALRSEGQLDEAARILREVVTSKPDYEVAHFELGRALLQQGDATAGRKFRNCKEACAQTRSHILSAKPGI
jgi:predicted Zn-dependent protease